jgi:hypothetical protein
MAGGTSTANATAGAGCNHGQIAGDGIHSKAAITNNMKAATNKV